MSGSGSQQGRRDAEQLLVQARKLFDNGDFEGVINELQKIPSLYPDLYARTWFILGGIYAKIENFEEAAKAFNTALENNHLKNYDSKIYAQAQFNLGVAYNELGDSEKAIDAYRSVQQKDNPETYTQAQFNLDNTYE